MAKPIVGPRCRVANDCQARAYASPAGVFGDSTENATFQSENRLDASIFNNKPKVERAVVNLGHPLVWFLPDKNKHD
jgi:hypothetical protein